MTTAASGFRMMLLLVGVTPLADRAVRHLPLVSLMAGFAVTMGNDGMRPYRFYILVALQTLLLIRPDLAMGVVTGIARKLHRGIFSFGERFPYFHCFVTTQALFPVRDQSHGIF